MLKTILRRVKMMICASITVPNVVEFTVSRKSKNVKKKSQHHTVHVLLRFLSMRCLFSVIILAYCIKLHWAQEIHQCVHATRKITKAGDGTTEDSCMGCDPTLKDCFSDCQRLVDQLYRQCDDVCLPDGYYFDPQFSLKGCWKDNKSEVKIKVERCGCNAALPSFSTKSSILLIVLIALIVYMIV